MKKERNQLLSTHTLPEHFKVYIFGKFLLHYIYWMNIENLISNPYMHTS